MTREIDEISSRKKQLDAEMEAIKAEFSDSIPGDRSLAGVGYSGFA